MLTVSIEYPALERDFKGRFVGRKRDSKTSPSRLLFFYLWRKKIAKVLISCVGSPNEDGDEERTKN